MEVQNRQRAIEALELLQQLLLGPQTEMPPSATAGQRRMLLARRAQHAIEARHKRREILGADLAAEPCWEILLTLYANWAKDTKTSVTDLSYESGIPSATVVRWLAVLVQRGFVCREADLHDGRRIWLRLTKTAVDSIEHVLTLDSASTPAQWQDLARAA